MSYFNENFPPEMKRTSCSLLLNGNHYITNLEDGLTHFISFCLSKDNVIFRTRKGKVVQFHLDAKTMIDIKLPTVKLAVDLEYNFNSWLLDDLSFKFIRLETE